MLKVNSRKTINNLVKSNLKEYKMRNLFTLITIILSVSLIAGFAFFSSAIQEANRKDLSQRQHVIYHDLTDEQILSLKQNSKVIGTNEFKRGNSFELNDYILLPSYMDENDSGFMKTTLTSGVYPTKFNEILVYEEMLFKMGLKAEVGQSISIPFLDGSTEEFIISGLSKSGANTDVFPIYFSKEYAKNGCQLKNVPFDLAVQIIGVEKMNSAEFLALIRQIGEENNVPRKNINENNTFVDSLSYSFKEVTMIALISVFILFVSVLVIYSIFYISISERTRQFGQLRTIGMTQKQVKKIVKKEGAILSLVGSAIGITIGSIFAFSLKPLGFNLSYFIIYSLAILIANFITVQISIAKPAKIAANISPIDASRMSGYEMSSKTLQTKHLSRKLSPLSLSYISASGNRKKSIMTILSLCLAGIVFMCSATLMCSINEEKYSRQSWFAFGDFLINISSNASQVNEHGVTGIQNENPLSDELIAQLNSIDGVKEVAPFQNLTVKYTYNDVNEYDKASPFTKEDSLLINQYLKDGTVDYEQMVKNKEIIIVHNDIAKEIFGWEFKVGDTILLNWYNGEEDVEEEFTVSAVLQKTNKLYRDSDMLKLSFNAGWFMIPKDLMTQMMKPNFNLNNRILISCDNYWNDATSVADSIANITDGNPLIKVSAFSDEIEHHKDQFNMLNAMFMGASMFVIAFSLINLLNTLISNSMARKREFACLGAIGATKKQIRTMILGEGIYFSIINLISAVLLGGLAGFITIKIMTLYGTSYLEYQFPVEYTIGYCIFILVVPVIISSVISRFICKKSLVERMREIE